jgi:polyhydroxyalkanoate synthase
VLRLLDVLAGPARFVLAGSGHIAGVVNPPAANKYATGPATRPTRSSVRRGRRGAPGQLVARLAGVARSLGGDKVPAKGKRAPGGKGDKVIEDAPGRYVATR